MSSPPRNPWLAVLPWLLAGVVLFAIAAAGGFGAAYLLSTGQAVATVDPSKLPTPSPAPTPTRGPATPTPAATPSATPSPPASPTAPAGASPSATASASEPAGPSPTPIRYVVKARDRLRDIADRFGVTVDAIVLLNHLDNPNHIEVGQVLLIPLP